MAMNYNQALYHLAQRARSSAKPEERETVEAAIVVSEKVLFDIGTIAGALDRIAAAMER